MHPIKVRLLCTKVFNTKMCLVYDITEKLKKNLKNWRVFEMESVNTFPGEN